jgi:hypothetical protein
LPASGGKCTNRNRLKRAASLSMHWIQIILSMSRRSALKKKKLEQNDIGGTWSK